MGQKPLLPFLTPWQTGPGLTKKAFTVLGPLRVSTQFVETIDTSDPASQKVRLSDQQVEVINSSDPASQEVRLSDQFVEVIMDASPQRLGRVTPRIFRPKDVIKVRGTKAYPTISTLPLTAGLLTNTNTFFGPTLTPGSVNLAPGLLTNTQTFFSPTIILGQILEPDVLTNTPTFYPPVLNGPATIEPPLYTSPNTFFPPTITVTQDLAPGLLTNNQTFFPPSLNPGLRPGLLINTQTFFPPTVAATTSGLIEPQIFINNSFFYPCEISVEPEPRPGDDRVFKVGRVVNKGYAPLSLKLR